MISSTSKAHFKISLMMLAGLLASCSHRKVVSEKKDEQRPGGTAPIVSELNMGPETTGSVFIDKTEAYGLKNVKAVHLYAVDVNHDGHTDLVVMDDFYAAPKFYFFNVKNKKFELQSSPFDTLVRGAFLNFADFDHDGFYDVLVGSLNQKTEMTQYPARLFKGEMKDGKLHYREVAPLPTTLLPTAAISVFDYNLDGKLDLYLANWFSYKDSAPKPVPDLLLMGKGNGFEFEDVSSGLRGEYDYNRTERVYSNATPTFASSTCDVDKNGFPDVLTSNSNGYFSKLWMNLDGKNFVNYGNESGYAADEEGSEQTRGGGNSFYSLCGDYNNDGLIDIAVGNLSRDSDPETRDRSAILSGSSKAFPPKFIRSEIYHYDQSQKVRWSEGDRRGVWIDYNLDGLSDLIVDNSGFPPDSRLVFYEQQKDHEYVDISKELGINILNPSGTITIDLNGDGVMDIITGQSKIRAGDIDNYLYVFENQTKREGKGSVRFHLQGKKSNTHGLSSSVTFSTNKTNRFFNVEYAGGPQASQNEEGASFSFGKEIPKEVIVRWAFAKKDRLERLLPEVVKYDLKKWNLKGVHTELNLCEDGRILQRPKSCY